MTRSRWKKIVTRFYRSLLFFWHHSENWVFLKTVSFHFQSIKWALTLQCCNTLAWKISHTCSLGAIFYLVRVEMASDWFTRIYRSILAEHRDMACKLGCGLFLSPQQIVVSFLWVCPVIDHEFRHNIVKVAVDPRSDSRVDPQTTLTMLWPNSWSITGQTH